MRERGSRSIGFYQSTVVADDFGYVIPGQR